MIIALAFAGEFLFLYRLLSVWLVDTDFCCYSASFSLHPALSPAFPSLFFVPLFFFFLPVFLDQLQFTQPVVNEGPFPPFLPYRVSFPVLLHLFFRLLFEWRLGFESAMVPVKQLVRPKSPLLPPSPPPIFSIAVFPYFSARKLSRSPIYLSCEFCIGSRLTVPLPPDSFPLSFVE